MDHRLNATTSACQLSPTAAGQLTTDGFAVIPGPIAPADLPPLAAAYDTAMASGDPTDLNIGSSTTRLNDLVNRGPEFDALYLHPPLLEACKLVIGAPFKLSSLLARTLRPHSSAQALHIDIPRHSPDLPMLGFIFMVDAFRPNNGATRFIPGSHTWPDAPEQSMPNRQASHESQVLACGPAGSRILFNCAVWHGHTANLSDAPRRSIQGYFVCREARSGIEFGTRMRPETLKRLTPFTRYLLAL